MGETTLRAASASFGERDSGVDGGGWRRTVGVSPVPTLRLITGVTAEPLLAPDRRLGDTGCS